MAGKRGFDVKEDFSFNKAELFFWAAFSLVASFVLTLIFFSGQVLLSPGEQATLERILPPSATNGVPFAVVLNLDVDEDNLPGVLGVEEFVPEGWQISGVSHNGKTTGNKIEWLFLNGVPLVDSIEDSVISYTITPSSLSGDFSGDWISGESEGNTTGDNSIAVSEPSGGTSGGTSGGSSSGGGASGGGRTASCVPIWDCGWSACVDGMQRTQCVDLNGCNSTEGKPSEEARSCYIKIESNRTPVVAPPIISSAGENIWTLWVLIFAIVFIAAIIFLLAYKTRINKHRALINKARGIVLAYRKEGYSEEQITELFKKRNWSEREIREALYGFVE